jgi:exodeoxyribonuclease VII large subunit
VAIRALDRYGVDVMIVGRGGGSLEDLWPFNEEVVVRAIFDAKTPVISAVGHEVDFSLSDFAADLRAPTPSAAAELVVQEQQALVEQVQILRKRLGRGLTGRLEMARNVLLRAQNSYIFRRPEELIRQRRQESDELRMRLEDALGGMLDDARLRLDHSSKALRLLSPMNKLDQVRDRLQVLRRRLLQGAGTVSERKRNNLLPLVAQLDALSPLAILSRGYALAWKQPENTLVRKASDLTPRDTISVRFGDGCAVATVQTIEDTKDGKG